MSSEKSHKLKKILIILGFVILVFWVLSLRTIPERITYGVSFSKFHADELKLNWRVVYLALLDDLKIRNFRFTAHWPNTEPQENKFNFTELDFQIREAQKRGASVILAMGRRLPGWPECHEPDWLQAKMSKIQDENEKIKFRNERVLKLIETVVNRYRDNPSIKMWQVENEPFLEFFGRSHCGDTDENFLKQEIELVKKLDSSRSVLITDSGEFGTWYKAYRNGDVFGTSLYLYVWWRNAIGPLRYPITPAFFRIKQSLIELFGGRNKPKIVIELSTEPWLLQPITDTPTEVLLARMGIDKFNEMIDFASKTGFDTQYLWGAEWWYYMKLQGYEEHWNRAKELFSK